MLEIDVDGIAKPGNLQKLIGSKLLPVLRRSGAIMQIEGDGCPKFKCSEVRAITIGFPQPPTAMLSEAFLEVRIRISSGLIDGDWVKAAALDVGDSLCSAPIIPAIPVVMRPTGGIWGERQLGTTAVIIPLEAVVPG